MYNYLLKCTDGIHKGMFLYMNTTPDGESFGSGDPDRLTMYIEGGDLDEEHAEIKFENDYQYVLRDTHSSSGTWVKINEIDLYQNSDRTFKFT